MKIAVLVYSNTGNTISVAEKILSKLVADGHEVDLINISEIRRVNIHNYEGFVFASPVEDFSLPPEVISFFKHMRSLRNKKVLCFVTQFLPFPWLGGNRAVRQLAEACKKRGAEVLGFSVINWSRFVGRKKQINSCVNSFSGYFTSAV